MKAVKDATKVIRAWPMSPIKGSVSGDSQEVIWSEVVAWLSQLRILKGVPFRYIVPHEEMLPNESIRFFHIDRNWLDALVDGAISVGRIGSEESKYDAEKYSTLTDELNGAEREHRMFSNLLFESHGNSDNLKIDGGAMSGFLLRSSVVRDFPGIEISAFDCKGENFDWEKKHRIPTIRQQKLSEGIMLCIFNGVPTHLRIQQPKEGMRQSIDHIEIASYPNPPYTLKMKDDEGKILAGSNNTIDVFTRKQPLDNSVLNIKSIFENTKDNHIHDADSSVIATQTLQYPYQQDFSIDVIVVKDSEVDFSDKLFDHAEDVEVIRGSDESNDGGGN